jgi:membrane-associated phospholipid phosphatase
VGSAGSLGPAACVEATGPRRDLLSWGGVLIAFPLLLFLALAAIVVDDPEPRLDYRLVTFLAENTEGSAYAGAADLLVAACLWLGLAILVVLVSVLAFRRRFTPALFLGAVTVGTLVVEKALKHAFERAAINQGGSYSFPSGSAMLSLGVVAAIVLLAGGGRRARASAVGAALVFAYGLAIVSLGWHYPSDVVAGWCVALALVAALWLAFGRPTFD